MDNVLSGITRQGQPAARRDQRQDSNAAALGEASRAMGLIANKNIPSNMKLELWNGVVAPAFDKMAGVGGVPTFREWPDEIEEYTKMADNIFKDTKIQTREKVLALKSLMDSAEEDINLAPGIQRHKEMMELQSDYETFEMLQIMTGKRDGNELTDEDVMKFADIRQRNPKAVVRAAEMIDNDRMERQGIDPGISASQGGEVDSIANDLDAIPMPEATPDPNAPQGVPVPIARNQGPALQGFGRGR